MKARAATAFLTVIFIGATCLGLALTTSRASAVLHELAETGEPGLLSLRIDPQTPLWATLAPGDSMHWLIEASLEDAASGTLALETRSAGALPEISGMTAEILACTGAFDLATDPPGCSGAIEVPLAVTPLTRLDHHDGRYDLIDLHRGDPRQILVTLAIPSSVSAEVIAGKTAHVGLGVHAAGEDPSIAAPVTAEPPPRAGLAVTGADVLALALLAAGLTGLGTVALIRRRLSATGGST